MHIKHIDIFKESNNIMLGSRYLIFSFNNQIIEANLIQVILPFFLF